MVHSVEQRPFLLRMFQQVIAIWENANVIVGKPGQHYVAQTEDSTFELEVRSQVASSS